MRKFSLIPSFNMKRDMKQGAARFCLCFIFTFSFLLSPVFSQGIWTSRDTLPDSAMFQGISGFSIGNYGYAGLGDTYEAGDPSPALWQFDPSVNSWTKKAYFPGRERVAPACFVIGVNAYLVTGSVRNGGTCVNECWEYNSITDAWTQKANFPGSARTYAVGFAIDSLGYVGTGANELSDFRKDFYVYHPSTNTWTRIADFPGIARSVACGFTVNGKGYVCFGQDSLFSGAWLNNDIWEYDPGTNSWTQKSSCPGYASYGSSGFVICNNIYVGSGIDSVLGLYNRLFWQYNTLSDTWMQETDIPGIKTVQGASFSIGDTGYYGFGADSNSFGVINAFYKFYAGDSCSVTTVNAIVSENSEIGIYPNPFNNKCTIKLPDSYMGKPLFTLLDITGKEEVANITYSSSDYILNKAQLNPGVYILLIKLEDRTYYNKLIIIN